MQRHELNYLLNQILIGDTMYPVTPVFISAWNQLFITHKQTTELLHLFLTLKPKPEIPTAKGWRPRPGQRGMGPTFLMQSGAKHKQW